MRLRQVVLVAAELEPSAARLRRLFALGPGFHDPGVGEFGLENVVFAIGDTFLEIVSPVEENTTAGRYLDRRGGDGGYMVILQIDDDMESFRRHVGELGVRIVWQVDHDDIKGTHLHPRDVGGAILSLDEATPPDSWRWAGPKWVEEGAASNATSVVGVELQSADPAALAARWGQVLRREVESTGGHQRILLDGGEIRFVQARDGRGEGVCAFDVTVADRAALDSAAAELGLAIENEEIRCCGIRFVLR